MGVGLFIRLHVLESPVFTARKAERRQRRLPILEVLRRHPRNVLLAMGARFAENAFFYIFTVLVLSYGTQQLGLPKAACSTACSSVPRCSSSRFRSLARSRTASGDGRSTSAARSFCILFAFPFFWLVDTKSTGCDLARDRHRARSATAAMYGPQAAFFSELFGTNVRYTGASLGYQLASPLAGGLAPFIATALLERFGGQPWPVAVYLIGMGMVTLVSVWLAAETHRADLPT